MNTLWGGWADRWRAVSLREAGFTARCALCHVGANKVGQLLGQNLRDECIGACIGVAIARDCPVVPVARHDRVQIDLSEIGILKGKSAPGPAHQAKR